MYQCFLTLPSVRLGNVYHEVSVPTLYERNPVIYWTLTFAISAQLFPASLMFFNLCSSAGVHGVLVRLFLAGGSKGADAILGSTTPAADEVATGADMARGGAAGARLLFRAAT